MNNGQEDKSAAIQLPLFSKLEGMMTATDLVTGVEQQLSAGKLDPFTLELPRKDGKIIEFKPA